MTHLSTQPRVFWLMHTQQSRRFSRRMLVGTHSTDKRCFSMVPGGRYFCQPSWRAFLFWEISCTHKCSWTESLFPQLVDVTRTMTKLTRNAEHHIVSNGPTKYQGYRRLPPLRLKSARHEFYLTLQIRIIEPSATHGSKSEIKRLAHLLRELSLWGGCINDGIVTSRDEVRQARHVGENPQAIRSVCPLFCALLCKRSWNSWASQSADLVYIPYCPRLK